MLTRLQVNGFKNLVDVDVRFGPFTCIAGPNGVGKSNLFDAIRFLSSLADKPFVDAAKCVRDESRRTGEVGALFHQQDGRPVNRMKFVAEMIVPKQGVDQLGLSVVARTTFLRYTLELGLVPSGPDQFGDRLELLTEELTYVKTAEHQKALAFDPRSEWTQSVVLVADKTKRKQYISTETEKGARVVYMHADGNTHKKVPRPAKQLNRTLLAATTSLESPTASLARLEMQSWRLLQLEPSSLRAPDEFGAESRLGADGSHLPATLYRLANVSTPARDESDSETLYNRVGLRLRKLIQDIRWLDVDRDEKRQLLTLIATDSRNLRLPARSLSDGTLRFLALSVLEEDEEAVGLLCFEEPENGIHPKRIPAMLDLLRDIAVDPELAVGYGNPLRQVIVNTHSPLVLTEVPQDALLGAVLEEHASPDWGVVRRVNFLPLTDTWRTRVKSPPRSLPLGELTAYLTKATAAGDHPGNSKHQRPASVTRVRDRADIQAYQQNLFDFLDPE